MQWILQEFEDTTKLALALDRLEYSYSWHRVVPFVGDLLPEPDIPDPADVILFGSYALRHYAQAHGLTPGVYQIRPFVHETSWQPYLLNGADATFLQVEDIPIQLCDDGRAWFMRPVADSKEEPGRVRTSAELIALAQKVCALNPQEIPKGSLAHDTPLMLTQPRKILKEWRIWVVKDKVITYSLYKEGSRVVYRPEIDGDALAFAQMLAGANAGYAEAYVLDICRTEDGLHMLETNCINAAGFYAADLVKLAAALNTLGSSPLSP